VSNCLLGFTPERLQPTEDFTLPDKFCLGLVRYQIILNKKRALPHSQRFQTNLVDRPSAEVSSPYFVANPVADGHVPQEAELSPTEMAAGVPAFLAKVARYRPRIVCFVGIGIWRVVEKALVKLATYPENIAPPGSTRTRKEITGFQPYKLVFPVDLGVSPSKWQLTGFADQAS
jgi:TDG/mug DNA glycosylase family protein